MKFLTYIALIGGAAAIRISQQSTPVFAQGPSAKDIMEMCDTNDNDMISKKEAIACIKKHAPADYQGNVEKQVNKYWPMVDKNQDGQVDIKELEAVMGGKKLAQIMGPSAEEIIKGCDKDDDNMVSLEEMHQCIDKHAPTKEDAKQAHKFIDHVWPMIDKSGDGKVTHEELDAAMKAKPSLAQVLALAEGPSPADIIEKCDASGNGELSKKEAHDCIDENFPEKHRKAAHEFIDKAWPHLDTSGNGEVDEHELAAVMRQKGSKLAQVLNKVNGPTPADIIDECDESGNGMLDKKEVKACIAKHVPKEHQEEAEKAVDMMWEHVDKNGDGEVDEHELSKAMRGGPPKQ